MTNTPADHCRGKEMFWFQGALISSVLINSHWFRPTSSINIWSCLLKNQTKKTAQGMRFICLSSSRFIFLKLNHLWETFANFCLCLMVATWGDSVRSPHSSFGLNTVLSSCCDSHQNNEVTFTLWPNNWLLGQSGLKGRRHFALPSRPTPDIWAHLHAVWLPWHVARAKGGHSSWSVFGRQ